MIPVCSRGNAKECSADLSDFLPAWGCAPALPAPGGRGIAVRRRRRRRDREEPERGRELLR